MAEKPSYEDWLKKEMERLIDAIDLPDLQKHFLRSRWLDQVVWMSASANKARNRYYALRMMTIIGGVLVPAGLTSSFGGLSSAELADVVRWLTFSISLIVAISAAVEEFFHFGERWRHYRRKVELLKGSGWQFFQLSGPFSAYANHADAYRSFAAQVEGILAQDVDVYITKVVQEKANETKEGKSGAKR